MVRLGKKLAGRLAVYTSLTVLGLAVALGVTVLIFSGLEVNSNLIAETGFHYRPGLGTGYEWIIPVVCITLIVLFEVWRRRVVKAELRQ